jgi:endonuclease V-like protein UPF0215 family
MRVHYQKKAIRCLGVAESFRKGSLPFSVLSGTVMRSDLVIDGIVLGKATLGGNDVTESIKDMFNRLKRKDVNLIMIGGSIVSLFNIVDVDNLFFTLGLPVISITYRASEGLEAHLRHHFPDETGKIEMYKRLGDRTEVTLHTGKHIFVRCSGLNVEDASKVVDRFTLQGAIAEPVRVSRIIARAVLDFVSVKGI